MQSYLDADGPNGEQRFLTRAARSLKDLCLAGEEPVEGQAAHRDNRPVLQLNRRRDWDNWHKLSIRWRTLFSLTMNGSTSRTLRGSAERGSPGIEIRIEEP